MAIRESDLMLICVAAAKQITSEYNRETNNAMKRISRAMFEATGEAVVVERAQDNPVERDIVDRCINDVMELVLGLIGGKGNG